MSAATPRPWRVEPDGRNLAISADGWDALATVYRTIGADQHQEAEANAALIVRAVNSHDALVAACEALLALSHDYADGRPVSTGDAFARWGQARAALALAKGGA